MPWGLSGWDGVNKRVCRFLIHRYLGHFLKEKISLEQLSVDLFNGTGHIQDVNVDVQYVNEILASLKAPIRVEDGYIGAITATVPWASLLQDSCLMEVKQLEMTLITHQLSDIDNPTVSMLESVIGSLASSMDLAKSFMNEEKESEPEDDEEGGGVETFARIIDAVMSRMRLVFVDTVIRFEGSSFKGANTSSAVEMRIDRIEFLDEQLEACRQQGTNVEPITIQPHSLYTIPDLNKILHLHGVRFYTDIFSGPDLSDLPSTSIESCQSFTRIHARRRQKKSRSTTSSRRCSEELYQSSDFHSCYSRMASTSESDNGAELPSFDVLNSDPVQFAMLAGEKQTIRLRLRNSTVSDDGPNKVDIQMFLGGLYVFLTPSQLYLLQDFLDRLLFPNGINSEALGKHCGKPMIKTDFTLVEDQLQHNIATDRLWNNDFNKGNWAGESEEHFYDTSRKPLIGRNPPIGEMSCVTLEESSPFPDWKPTPTPTFVKARMSGFWLVVTHKDPLGMDICTTSSVNRAVDTLRSWSDHFFHTCTSISLSARSDLVGKRLECDRAFSQDHLRFLGCPLMVDYTRECHSVSVHCSLSNCELLECLVTFDVDKSDQLIHVPLLVFFDQSDERNFDREQAPNLTMRLVKVDDHSTPVSLCLELSPCRSELDVTLLDRINHLTHCRPSFVTSKVDPTNITASLHLKEDLFTASNGRLNLPPGDSFQIELRCIDWTVDLKIPVADLREHDRAPWWIRQLREETLSVKLRNVHLLMPRFETSALAVHGSVTLSASTVVGQFIGHPDIIGCGENDSRFLYAGGIKGGVCSISLKWDLRNKSLRMEQQNISPDNGEPTCWESYFKLPNSKEDGPFSKKVILHENEELTMAGSCSEMLDFGHKCLQNTDLSIRLTVPVFRLYLPNKTFYEVLYNRLVNDLVLWQPSSPPYNVGNSNQDYDIRITGLGDLEGKFQLCRSTAAHRDSDDESESGSAATLLDKSSLVVGRTSHRICLLLSVDSARILIGPFCLSSQCQTDDHAELVVQGKTGQMFLVNGYGGDPNVVYFYLTAKLAHLWHQNLPTPLSCTPHDVQTPSFCLFSTSSACQLLLPTPDCFHFCNLSTNDDNFAASLRLDFCPKNNRKDILAAVSVRNSSLSLRPVSKVGHFWTSQLVDFFDVADYPIAGYKVPEIATELHVNVSNSQLVYEHCCIKEESPLQFRLALDSLDISSRIVADFCALKLRCLFEGTKLYLSSSCPTKQMRVNFENVENVCKNAQKHLDFVCLLRVGFFELEVTVSQDMFINEQQSVDESRRSLGPMLEVKCKNDIINIWTCSDSLALIITTIKELTESKIFSKSSTNSNSSYHRTVLTSSMEQHLEQMVESAMCHTASRNEPGTNVEQGHGVQQGLQVEESTFREVVRSRVVSQDSDDGFCIVDEIPGSGVTLASGHPRIRQLSGSDLILVENHFPAPDPQQSEHQLKLPPKYPQPLIRYLLKNFSVLLHLYGGSDFDPPDTPKTYSVTSRRGGQGRGQRVELDAKGGVHRDHSVLVQVQLNKICFLYELFGIDSPALARYLLTVHDVQILDRLSLSQIDKLLYQYSSSDRPRRTLTPLFSVRLIEFHGSEARLKISCLPLRLNVDQDSLEFLMDFAAVVGAAIFGTVQRSDISSSMDEPEMHVPNRPSSALRTDLFDSGQSVCTLAGFFAENESAVNLHDWQFFDSESVKLPKCSSNDNSGKVENSRPKSRASTTGELFFKDVSFSPSVNIRLDYEPKRVKTDQGAFMGLLIGLSQLHCTELTLQEVHTRQGILGVDKVVQYIIGEWLTNIRTNQIPQVVGSYGPISSLVQIGQGVRDLFLLPVDECRKTNGHVVKGVQKGAESFSVSTASAAVELTQRLVAIVQGAAEFAFDIVTPDYPRNRPILTIVKQPTDLRQGLHMAYDTVYDVWLISTQDLKMSLKGMVDAAQTLQLAAQEDRAQGRWPLKGLLRQATPTVLRPIVVASRATNHLLGGLRNQLKPDSYREQLEKWRRA